MGGLTPIETWRTAYCRKLSPVVLLMILGTVGWNRINGKSPLMDWRFDAATWCKERDGRTEGRREGRTERSERDRSRIKLKIELSNVSGLNVGWWAVRLWVKSLHSSIPRNRDGPPSRSHRRCPCRIGLSSSRTRRRANVEKRTGCAPGIRRGEMREGDERGNRMRDSNTTKIVGVVA